MKLVKAIDDWLNNITMYRLLMYGLGLVLFIAVAFGYSGVISYSGTGILAVTATLFAACYLSNKLFGYLYRATTNSESYIITALILACILPPSTDPIKLGYIALAGVIAMASKFVLSYRHKHIFNPAALAATVISLCGLVSVTWWIGSPAMLPYVLMLGLFITRKIHRFRLVGIYIFVAILMLCLVAFVSDQSAMVLIKNAVLSGPMIFFAGIMLTEPATMPALHYYQILYGILVGALYSAQLRYGILSTSPHMVLLAGNVFAFIVNPKIKINLRLKEKIKVSEQVYDYVFTPERKFNFIAGQYMEWTLGHKKIDGRGNRRSFTIASSPTEAEVHLGVKFYEPSSSFKKAMLNMRPGDLISAGHIAGNFVLPKNPNKKLVFIAGGIGITPFRSMVKYLLDNREHRDITLFYVVNKSEELAYKDIWQEASREGMQFVPLVANGLNIEILQKYVIDYQACSYYLSGPNGLVRSYKDHLISAGVPSRRIITDYFSGY